MSTSEPTEPSRDEAVSLDRLAHSRDAHMLFEFQFGALLGRKWALERGEFCEVERVANLVIDPDESSANARRKLICAAYGATDYCLPTDLDDAELGEKMGMYGRETTARHMGFAAGAMEILRKIPR